MKNKKFNFSVVASLVTFIAVVIMFALGMWQLQRAEEKTNRLLSIQQGATAGQMTLQKLLNTPVDDMVDMPVSIKGKADPIKYFLIDNKIHQGRVGYYVLVAIKTELGLVFANLGWVAAMNSRSILPDVIVNPELTEYSGMVSFPTKNLMVKETAQTDGKWPKVLQQIDIEVMQQHFQKDFLPFVVLLDEDPTSGFERKWQAVVMPPEKHIAYAIQWFLLAIAAVVIFVVAQRRKIKQEQL